MMRIMTEEEVAEREAITKEYKESRNLVDQLIGILMDIKTGGFSLHEDIAIDKAHAIAAHIHKENVHEMRKKS